MLLLASIIHYLIPITALILLISGYLKKAINYITSSLWLSLIALVIQYQNSGGCFFGSYFNYLNSVIYSLNLIIFTTALISLSTHLNKKFPSIHTLLTLAQAFIVLFCLLILSNLWINAFFIENRREGTPIIQVALMKKPDYCAYKFIFYKMERDGSTGYLCPNYYGLIPQLGHLKVAPDFLVTQQPD